MIDISTIGKHAKPLADSTLNNMKKTELIKYVRTLEHNCNVAVSWNVQQAENFNAMLRGMMSVEVQS